MRQLDVYMNDRKAGVLVERHTGSGYIFRYDENYLASDGPAISVTMPKLRVPLESEILFPVFADMLPEGSNRKIICRSLRIDENDCFGLLAAMAGKDFIGAVNVKPITL